MRPQYERVPVDQLKFDPKNSRKHDTKNIKAIKESLLKFGQQKPIVVMADGTVIAGNGTLQAFKELLKETGQQEMWSTIDVHWSALKKSEAKAYGLADNRSAELAMWDDSQLKESLEELSAEGWDLGDLGWDDADLKDVIDSEQGTEGLTDEDAVPEVEQNVFGVKLGDIWQLGNHRLMCGDSTDKATVEKLMNGEKAEMVFTDPPYGVEYHSQNSTMYYGDGKKGKERKKIIGDENTDLYIDVLPVINAFCTGPTYIFCGAGKEKTLLDEIDKNKFTLINTMIWDKMRFGGHALGANYKPCFEMFYYLISKTSERFWGGKNNCETLWRLKRDNKTDLHPTQKPVELAHTAIANHSSKSVLDLFLGSGSTLIACEKTGRKCYGMELDPHYCSVIIKRWQDFTGKTANLVTR